ncbi:MAG: hypothetical protein ABSH26_09115 [Opitutaceae bacterium]|jgi:hypothetical protein
MKTEIPEALKADLPPNVMGKVFGATPIVMTVLATILAGLSSSEITRAQYDRALAAQMQSKAGDQWNFFQGKKLRGALQRNTLDLMVGTTEVHPLTREALLASLANTPAGTAMQSAVGQQVLTALTGVGLPIPSPAPDANADVQAALAALDASRPDAELVAVLARIQDSVLENALHGAQAQALGFDAVIKPIGQVIDLVEKQLAGPDADSALRRSFVAARLGYAALRYDAEARLNQTIANLYELQVRKGNMSAERHYSRSQKFFYGMLTAQAGVIIATLAIAARKRSLLWSLAAGAGTAALSFAVYVYLSV